MLDECFSLKYSLARARGMVTWQESLYKRAAHSGWLILHWTHTQDTSTCQDEEKVEKAWERVAPSVTGRFFVITSRESPSRLFDVSPAEEASSASLDWSTRRLAVFSRFSSRTSSVMPSRTRNTPRGRLSPRWTSCTPWSARAALCTVLEAKSCCCALTSALFRATNSQKQAVVAEVALGYNTSIFTKVG